MGGVDWTGFDLFCALRDVENIEWLAERMVILRNYKPPGDEET